MNETERTVLEILNKQLLVTKGELQSKLGQTNGVESALQKLKDQGLIEKVESLGTSFVITKAGIRKLR